MSPVKVALVRCRSCAFENQRDAPSCFLCGQSLAGAEPVVARERPGVVARSASPAPREVPLRLTSMVLPIALIAVLVGVLQISSGLAVCLAIPLTIAFARTVGASSYRDRGSWLDDLGVFAMTFLTVAGVAIAAVAALVVTCTVSLGSPRFH